jgi:hypothetical protein
MSQLFLNRNFLTQVRTAQTPTPLSLLRPSGDSLHTAQPALLCFVRICVFTLVVAA